MNWLIITTRRGFCDLSKRNKAFQQRMNVNRKQFNIHQKLSQIDTKKMGEYVGVNDKEKIANQMAKRANYDAELKNFISNFNSKHKDSITLLDFSRYVNQYGDLVNKPLTKNDLDILKEFQKRKVDQKIHEMKQQQMKRNEEESFIYEKFPERERIFTEQQKTRQQLERQEDLKMVQRKRPRGSFPSQAQYQNDEPMTQGPLQIRDNFMMLLLDVKINTKITTLNRINSYKTLVFMGNGNGIISYAKGKGKTPGDSLERAIYLCKKNIIAIPRDIRCTFPRQINTRFQDFYLYMRPLPGFNAHGHPIISMMLTLAGMDHCGFKVSHTQKNIYNALKVVFKAVTKNTTPQQLAQRQGFKVYRHQFIRPLTYKYTHCPLSR